MKRSARWREKRLSLRYSRRQERSSFGRFGPSTTFGLPLDIGQLWRAISSASFSRSLPLRERTRERGARSLERVAPGGSCSRDSALLRLQHLGRTHGLEEAYPG